MPRNVRNYWLEAYIDGRATKLEGGPIAKDGGFDLTIYQRDKGGVASPILIRGYAIGSRLELEIRDEHNQPLYSRKTER